MSSQDIHRGPLNKDQRDAITQLAFEAAEEMASVDNALEELRKMSRHDGEQ
jgi:hypothetical protein